MLRRGDGGKESGFQPTDRHLQVNSFKNILSMSTIKYIVKENISKTVKITLHLHSGITLLFSLSGYLARVSSETRPTVGGRDPPLTRQLGPGALCNDAIRCSDSLLSRAW